MAKLSSAELAAREKFIQGMKKNKRKLIKKYGADAEKVMYGSSTTKAKKLAERDMGQNKLREMVKAALMQPVSEKKSFPDLTGDGKVTKADILKGRGVDLKEGPEDMYWSEYVKSLVNDIRINGLKSNERDYTTFSEDDFVADYEDYIGNKMMSEDLDLGHEDNEPHMIKAELYRIGKYAMELYQMVDQFEGMGEVDFPAWWQSKITTSANNMISAKHYLDFETKEPEIDAMVGVAAAEDIISSTPTEPLEGEIEEGNLGHNELASLEKEGGSWIVTYRTMDGKKTKVFTDEDEARAFMNTTLEEGLPKGYWSKKIEGGVDEIQTDMFATKASKTDSGKETYFKFLRAFAKSAGKSEEELGKMSYNDLEKEFGQKLARKHGLKKINVADKARELVDKGVIQVDESYEALVKKLKGQGKSEKAAKAIAGAVASYKAKGGGKGPTAKQKAR